MYSSIFVPNLFFIYFLYNQNKTARKCTVKLKFVYIDFHVLYDSKMYHEITLTNCVMNVQHKALFLLNIKS